MVDNMQSYQGANSAEMTKKSFEDKLMELPSAIHSSKPARTRHGEDGSNLEIQDVYPPDSHPSVSSSNKLNILIPNESVLPPTSPEVDGALNKAELDLKKVIDKINNRKGPILRDDMGDPFFNEFGFLGINFDLENQLAEPTYQNIIAKYNATYAEIKSLKDTYEKLKGHNPDLINKATSLLREIGAVSHNLQDDTYRGHKIAQVLAVRQRNEKANAQHASKEVNQTPQELSVSSFGSQLNVASESHEEMPDKVEIASQEDLRALDAATTVDAYEKILIRLNELGNLIPDPRYEKRGLIYNPENIFDEIQKAKISPIISRQLTRAYGIREKLSVELTAIQKIQSRSSSIEDIIVGLQTLESLKVKLTGKDRTGNAHAVRDPSSIILGIQGFESYYKSPNTDKSPERLSAMISNVTSLYDIDLRVYEQLVDVPKENNSKLPQKIIQTFVKRFSPTPTEPRTQTEVPAAIRNRYEKYKKASSNMTMK